MEKRDKIKIIGVLSIFIVCIIGSFIVMFKNDNISKDKEVNKTETEKEIEKVIDELLSDEDKEILTKDEQMSLVMGDFMGKYQNSLKLGKESSPEFPEEESRVFYNELIKRAETADYNTIISVIEDKASTYKFHEEYNWKIGDLYYDATLMIATLDVPVENKGQMVKNMKDPYMMLIGTLMLQEEARRSVIGELDSLSPIFEGSVSIKEHQEIEVNDDDFEDKFMDTILTKYFSVNKIHKFYFEVELNPLIAYMVEYGDGTFEFVTIVQDGEYECYYKTIRYWIGLDY